MAGADNIRGDNKFMRLAVLLEPEIARMLDAQASRTVGFDDAQFDPARNVVAYFARGHLLWEARAEVIGAYLPDFGLWRWWWTGRIAHSGAKCSMDLAFSEGQRHGINLLRTEHPRIALDDDAVLLANVCAHLARADGMFRMRDDEKTTFYALFDTGKVKRGSVLPPAPATATSTRPMSAVSAPPQPRSPTGGIPSRAPVETAASSNRPVVEQRYSVPTLDDPFEMAREPARATNAPRDALRDPSTSTRMAAVAPATGTHAVVPATGSHRPSVPIREPGRDIFLPVAQIAFSAIHTTFPNGFHQALLVLTVETHEGKARFSALIVASGENHDLVVVDSPRELVDAAAKMIAEDARSGNGRWRRLTARLSRTQRGASVDITVG